MSAARLLEHFDRVADAPGAVPRLRRFILDGAMRGLLSTAERGASLHWRQLELRDCATLFNGRAYKQHELLRAGTPVIRIQNLNGGHSWYYSDLTLEPNKYCATGDLLFAWSGTFGPYIWDGPPGIFHYHIWKLLLEPHVDKRFMFYLLQNLTASIKAEAHGLMLPHMTKQGMESWPVRIPDLVEQKSIVRKLDELMALCDRLETAQAERDTRRDCVVAASFARVEVISRDRLEPSMPAVHIPDLRHMTVRRHSIDAVREFALDLAVTGRLGTTDLREGGAAAELRRLPRHREEMTAPPAPPEDGSYTIPRLPDNWSWSIVGGLASAEPNAITDGPFGANLKTEHYVPTPGFRVVRLQNVGRRIFRDEHRSFIGRDHFDRLTKHHVFAGDLVIAGLVDPFLRCCRLPDDIGPALVKADCYRFSVHPSLSASFMSYYLNSMVAQRFAAAHHHGMTLIRVGLGNFRHLPVPVPPLAEQHRIVAKLDVLMAVCDRLETQIAAGEATSSRLLDALLHEALGESAAVA
jgi:type I restriction enzyme S subunit